MAAANGDLAAKYQRLATEYAKLKAQIPVLKKAVIDEQTKVSFIIPSHASEIDPSAVRNIFYPRLVSPLAFVFLVSTRLPLPFNSRIFSRFPSTSSDERFEQRAEGKSATKPTLRARDRQSQLSQSAVNQTGDRAARRGRTTAIEQQEEAEEGPAAGKPRWWRHRGERARERTTFQDRGECLLAPESL